MTDINSNSAAPERPADQQPSTPASPAADTPPAPTSDPLATLKLKPLVIEAVSKVYDPEIPVNIYELGLIYDIAVDSSNVVSTRMTLTAPNCPAAQTLPAEVAARAKEAPGVTDVNVEIVWDPPGGTDKMSDAAKLQLGML